MVVHVNKWPWIVFLSFLLYTALLVVIAHELVIAKVQIPGFVFYLIWAGGFLAHAFWAQKNNKKK